MGLYVDDGFIGSRSRETLDRMINFLGKEFEIRSFSADRFIGNNLFPLYILTLSYIQKFYVFFSLNYL